MGTHIALAALLALASAWCVYRGLTHDRKKHGSTRVIGWDTSGLGAVIGFFQEFLQPRAAYLIAGAIFALPAVGYTAIVLLQLCRPA